MGSTDESFSHTGYEPKDYFLTETYVESLTESMTEQRFPEQRFLEDVDYDDAGIGEMLFNAYREQVYHSQREGLSVGQSSSSMSDRTVKPVVETGQEQNPEHAQIRTLLDRQREQILADCQAEIRKHIFQADYDRRSIQKLNETIESSSERVERQERRDLCSSGIPEEQLLTKPTQNPKPNQNEDRDQERAESFFLRPRLMNPTSRNPRSKKGPE